MAAKFEIIKDKSGEYRFHLKAGNGEIIAASQGYESKAGAQNGIESIKKNAPTPPSSTALSKGLLLTACPFLIQSPQRSAA